MQYVSLKLTLTLTHHNDKITLLFYGQFAAQGKLNEQTTTNGNEAKCQMKDPSEYANSSDSRK